MQMERLPAPQLQTGTNTPRRTATPTRTPGAAGRKPAAPPTLTLPTVGEAATVRTRTAHRHSAASEGTTPVAPAAVAGVHAPPVRRAGAAAVAAADGVAEDFMVVGVVLGA